jgi:tellurite methyltransferase
MPNSDAARWNERYTHTISDDYQTPRSFLIEHLHLLPSAGLALDVAMGAGKNTRALLDLGIDPIGIDISTAAVMQARSHFPDAKMVIADLTHFYLPDQYFDLVLNFYYLQRELWTDYRRILKPGGILIFETLTEKMLTIKPELTPEFLLKEGELRESFQDWDIVVYREGWVTADRGYSKSVASMVARKPA